MNHTYRLNGEAHAGLHGPDTTILGIVGDVGRAMEQVVDAMSSVLPNHSALCGTGNWFSGS